MNFILADDHSKYKTFNIVLHGSYISNMLSPSNIQRHKVFSKTAMRCVLSPQFLSKRDDIRIKMRNSLVLRGYGLDNGAYSDFLKGTDFNGDSFISMCQYLGNGADWIAIPDIVGDGSATLQQAPIWIKKLRSLNLDTMLLIVWQDGMTRSDLLPFVKDGIGVFIGGSTEGKLKAIPMVSELCREHDVWCHVGRVNTMQRVQYCKAHKVKSVDGSGFSRFLHSHKQFIKLIDYLEKQISLFQDEPLDFSRLKTFQQRLDVFNMDSSIYDDMLKINTDYIGITKDEYKEDSAYLRWDR